MASKLNWKSVIKAPQYNSLQPSKFPLNLIPFDSTFLPSLSNPDKVSKFAATYDTQPNDVILSTYTKCGSYLLNKICVEIIRQSDKNNVNEIYKNGDIGTAAIPFITHFVSDYNENEIEKRIQLTSNTTRLWFDHLPIDLLPFKSLHKDTKIITMIRNPKDMIVSQYHHYNKVAQLMDIGKDVDATIDDYISYFIRGINVGGCYFNFYEKYWNAYKYGKCFKFNNVNVLFVYYEDIINNETKTENIQKIASFLGRCNDLDDNDYNNILNNIQFDNMKKELINNPQSFELGGEMHLRKGKNNDWINYLDQNQSYLIDETMYFKWAQYANDIKYYQSLFDKFSDSNQGYHSV